MKTTMRYSTIRTALLIAITAVAFACGAGNPSSNLAASSSNDRPSDSPAAPAVPETAMSAEARAALKKLTSDVPAAASLMQNAKAVVVFPAVVKGGFIVGAFHGGGAMFNKQDKLVAYYNTSGASYGLQAGIERYGYALFFMNDQALDYLNRTEGFEIGAGPRVVVVNASMAKSITTTTALSDVYAFIFDQSGLMAGVGLQGSRIYRVSR